MTAPATNPAAICRPGRCAVLRQAMLVVAAMVSLGGCAISRQIVYAPDHDAVALEPGPAGLPQPIHVTSADGLDLAGYYWPGAPGDPDVAIYFHGRHWNAQRSANAARYLSGAGDAVIVASYRGFDDNPGRPSEDGLSRDAAAFIARARALGGPDARIWLVGHSIGAAVALRAAAQDGHVDGVIALSSFVRIADAAPRITRALIPDRWDNAAALAALHIPVIFIQGALDRLVPQGSAATLFAGYDGPASLVMGEESRHNPDMAQIGPWISQAIAAMAGGTLATLPAPPPGWVEKARRP